MRRASLNKKDKMEKANLFSFAKIFEQIAPGNSTGRAESFEGRHTISYEPICGFKDAMRRAVDSNFGFEAASAMRSLFNDMSAVELTESSESGG